METITIHKAKTELSRLIEWACRGEEIVIARGKKPVVRLVAIGDKTGRRRPDALRGKLKVGPDFFEPLPPEELDAWEQWHALSGCSDLLT
jgi:antitoxin (DNA-binding transcriptional repressor) of toxin-antitoxin stability system